MSAVRDNKAAGGIKRFLPLNPPALILPQKKSRLLAKGEETLLQLIKHKVAVVVHKIFLSRRSAREDSVWKDLG